MKKWKNRNKGITLIALVITIIVLLILAGVTIATLTGDNGLLTKASNSKEKNEEVKKLELIQLAISAAKIEGEGTLTTKNLNDELNANFNDNKTVNPKNEYWTYKGYKIYKDGNIDRWIPEEYQQVEYIESTGGQYFDTKYIATKNTNTEYKIKSNIYKNGDLIFYHHQDVIFHSIELMIIKLL